MSSIAASVGAERRVLRIIAGPTGAGKSALALSLAERHGARIISADSRQIYRGFDIGTAKPTAEERERVAHAGIDVADPTERWSAMRWAREADGWLAEDAARGRASVIVGGTGLWLQALVRPLAAEPAMDPARREALQHALASLETEELRRWVLALDPARAHLGRTQLNRAAEVALLSGTRLSEWHARHGTPAPRPARWLIVDPGPALERRLDARRDAMLAGGWLEEVRALVHRVPATAPAWNACGYREIREVVLGERTLDAATEAVRIATRQYAKRQRTWFRNQLQEVGEVTRLDPTAPDAAAVAEHWFSKGLT
jgi:tRNA dimethylallyltransferase